MKPVYIEWLDIVTLHGWEEFDSIKEEVPALCKTLGFMLHEDQTKIVIVMNYSMHENKEEVNCATIIPKAVIKRMEHVKLSFLEIRKDTSKADSNSHLVSISD